MNPTPKGDMPTDEASQRQMQRYLSKISGPMVDRVDIHVEVAPVPYRELTGRPDGVSSATLRQQVMQARQTQCQRNGGPLKCNARLSGRELDKHAVMDEQGKSLLEQAMTELGLSARAYDKVRRVARTIADLDDSHQVQAHHIAEAVQYRLLDRVL